MLKFVRFQRVICLLSETREIFLDKEILTVLYETNACRLAYFWWRMGLPASLMIISINLLVVYRESVNLIGYITRRLSADSLQL